MLDEQNHATVLLNEAVEALAVIENGCYVDGTFGRGGHSREILKRLNSQGCLLGIDKDPQAVEVAKELEQQDKRFQVFHGSFMQLQQAVTGIDRPLNGLLLDLGVSSPQLDDASRGFSFSSDGPLDMRMDTSRGITAAQWLAQADEGEIVSVLKDYGEEKFARRIARAVVERRMTAPVQTTAELARLVSDAMPRHDKHKHPATRSFQAIRIRINEELIDLEKCLQAAIEILARGGRLVVISFHSLEDRIVKRFFRKLAEGDRLPKGVPVQHEQTNAKVKLIGKAVFPSEQEIAQNPRARSAVMRVAEVL